MTTTEHAWPAAQTGDAPSARWTAFIFRLPGASGRARTALWRALNDLGALKLGQGTWAIPHRNGCPPDLDRAFAQIHSARGEAWARDVGDDEGEDLRLQQRLCDACEQLWDRFFNEADRVAYLAHDDPIAAAGQLTDLRTDFGQLYGRDLVVSAAAHRAERRLDDLTMIIRARLHEDGAVVGPDHLVVANGVLTTATPRGGHVVTLLSAVEVADEQVRAVMCVTPTADAEWERAFNEFERFAYAPDERRSVLRHNTFTVMTTAVGLPAEQATARQRVARFEAFATD